LVAASDIGWFAARALEDPERYAGREIPLAGDELSVPEFVATYKQVTGRAAWVAPIPKFLQTSRARLQKPPPTIVF